MRTEHGPQLLVATLADEVQVDLAERRGEAVRVVAEVLDAVLPRGEHAVVHRAARIGTHAGEDPVPLVLEVDHDVVLEAHPHAGGERSPDPHAQAGGLDVLAEDVVGLGAAAVGHGPQGARQGGLGDGCHDGTSRTSASTAAVGSASHPGRWWAS